jgi:hypothetical protein
LLWVERKLACHINALLLELRQRHRATPIEADDGGDSLLVEAPMLPLQISEQRVIVVLIDSHTA